MITMYVKLQMYFDGTLKNVEVYGGLYGEILKGIKVFHRNEETYLLYCSGRLCRVRRGMAFLGHSQRRSEEIISKYL